MRKTEALQALCNVKIEIPELCTGAMNVNTAQKVIRALERAKMLLTVCERLGVKASATSGALRVLEENGEYVVYIPRQLYNQTDLCNVENAIVNINRWINRYEDIVKELEEEVDCETACLIKKLQSL